MAKSVPIALCIRLFLVRKICFLAVSNIEQIRKEAYSLSLDAVAHKSCCGNIQELAQKVKKRSFNGSYYMYAGTKVKCLQAANVVLDVLVQPISDLVQCLLVIADAASDDQVLYCFEGCRDLLSAGHFANAFCAGRVSQDDDISGKIRCMCTGEIQFHAVMSGYRIYFHLGNNRYHSITSVYAMRSSPLKRTAMCKSQSIDYLPILISVRYS